MKLRLAPLALPLLVLACSETERATLLEPPTVSADVTIEAAPPTSVVGPSIRYPWNACTTNATQVNGRHFQIPAGFACLIAEVLKPKENGEPGLDPVTKGGVTWYYCAADRQGEILRAADVCENQDGYWVKVQQGGPIKLNDVGWAVAQAPFGCLGVAFTVGYKFVFKGGGEAKPGEFWLDLECVPS